MKQTSTARAIAAAALFTSLAGCSSGPWDRDDAGQGAMGGGMQGSTASGSGGNSAECDQYHQMTSPNTPSDQLALMDLNMKRMGPLMRERHMSSMRKMCGATSQAGETR